MTAALRGLAAVPVPPSVPASPSASVPAHASAPDPMLRVIADEVRVDGAQLHVAGYAHPLPDAEGSAAVQWVSHVLYHRYYHRHETRDAGADPFARPDADARRPLAAVEDPARGRALREALAGRHVWEPGWSVIDGEPDDDGPREVERDGLVLYAMPEELRRDADGWSVRFPAQRPFASVGYFAVTGIADVPAGRDGLVRCYLNLAAEHACAVFAELVRDLDRRAIPFSAKVANNDRGFDRPDSAVLYVEHRYLAGALAVVHSLHTRHRDAFDDDVPAFTRQVAPGVGLADEPSQALGPVSFGQHRCALIAEALVSAGPAASADQRFDRMLSSIADAGLDPARLHLDATQLAADTDATPDYAIEWPT